jgi:predicted ABC-type ATPase
LKPTLFIITGSNGAGKSTVGTTYLPIEIQKNYLVFDGDKLALQKRRELSGIIKSYKEARKSADEWVYKQFGYQVKKAIDSRNHFAYEGHFRNPDTLKTPRRFKKNGYEVSLIFMGLADPHQSELRVIDRAKQGGHKNIFLHSSLQKRHHHKGWAFPAFFNCGLLFHFHVTSS